MIAPTTLNRKLATPSLCALTTCLLCLSASAEIIYGVTASGISHKRDTLALAKDFEGPPDETIAAGSMTFNIWYDDGPGLGFNNGAERRARFHDALNYVASILNESGELDILVQTSEDDGSGFLARAGTYFSDDPIWQNGSAFDRLTHVGNVKPFDDFAEIFVKVDWGYDWHTAVTAPAFGKFDLQSALTHELTHGLGFLSLSDSSGEGILTDAPNTFSIFDDMLRTGAPANTDLFTTILGLPSFNATSSALRGSQNGVVFAGAAATSIFGTAPPIYAPSTWASGSSLSHWDKDADLGPNGAVMESTLPFSTSRRQFQPFEIGALYDIGWTNIDLPDSPFDEGEGEGEPISGQVIARPSIVVQGISLVLTGPEGSDYQWFKDDAILDSETSRSYTIDSVGPKDEGSYVLRYDDGPAKTVLRTEPYWLQITPGQLPAASAIGIGLLLGACLGGGVLWIRRRGGA